MNPHLPLTDAQIRSFLAEGFLHLSGCFTEADAEPLIADAFATLGYDRSDPATWTEPLRFLYPTRAVRFRDFAPTAWSAALQLLGGEDRLADPNFGVGQWVINFRRGADEPWRAPAPDLPGWHVDGNFFRHFLDSPEQGLLLIPIFSTIAHRGGGTFLACDSVPVVAQRLARNPEGLRLEEFGFPELLNQCRDFREVTADAGDVLLIHPFMLHNFSQNHSGKPRLITNLCVSLREPMRFHRDQLSELSPVERGVLAGLGVERQEFQATAPRERLDPKGME